MNLSIHTALIVQPQASGPTASVRTGKESAYECAASSGLHGVGDAVAEVVVEQLHGDALERPRRRGHLRQDVDAVRVVVDHPLEAADLALDAAETGEQALDVLGELCSAGVRCRIGLYLHTHGGYGTMQTQSESIASANRTRRNG